MFYLHSSFVVYKRLSKTAIPDNFFCTPDGTGSRPDIFSALLFPGSFKSVIILHLSCNGRMTFWSTLWPPPSIVEKVKKSLLHSVCFLSFVFCAILRVILPVLFRSLVTTMMSSSQCLVIFLYEDVRYVIVLRSNTKMLDAVYMTSLIHSRKVSSLVPLLGFLSIKEPNYYSHSFCFLFLRQTRRHER